MRIYKKITELRQEVLQQLQLKHTIGLVPTMGNLHAGHLDLVRSALDNCNYVICSIFINPLQFGPNEDLDAYPRTLAEDIAKLEAAGCDCLFHPETVEIYPQGSLAQTKVMVPALGIHHCGRSRPGHFDGVTTVVNKLFNICQPTRAFFGLKDYQQYLIIRKMSRDLHIPIEICGIETHREESGLAMSSRNNYLNEEQRRQAPLLYQTLKDTERQLKNGENRFADLEQSARNALSSKGIESDYFSICNAETLLPAQASDQEIVILAAIYLGKSRLIDNIRVSLA